MRSTNDTALPGRLAASPAYNTTQDLNWDLYSTAFVTLTASSMTVTNTFTCSNKVNGQVFDLWLSVDAAAMTINITWPTNKAPSGDLTFSNAGIYHFRLTYINSTLYIERVAKSHA